MNGEMVMLRSRMLLIGFLVLSGLAPRAARPAEPSITNLTGLPAYPNLTSAAMERVWRTETFGRWCAKFTAESSDSLSTVESWYRKALARASETDLTKDYQYAVRPQLAGIKLALGIDYVTVYRTTRETTIIELHRCSWTH